MIAARMFPECSNGGRGNKSDATGIFGVTRSNLSMARKVLRANASVAEDVIRGDISIDAAHQQIKPIVNRSEIEQFPADASIDEEETVQRLDSFQRPGKCAGFISSAGRCRGACARTTPSRLCKR